MEEKKELNQGLINIINILSAVKLEVHGIHAVYGQEYRYTAEFNADVYFTNNSEETDDGKTITINNRQTAEGEEIVFLFKKNATKQSDEDITSVLSESGEPSPASL